MGANPAVARCDICDPEEECEGTKEVIDQDHADGRELIIETHENSLYNRLGRSTENVEELKGHKKWVYETFFKDMLLRAMQQMTEQLSAVGLQQMFMVGTLFDAKEQIETQQDFRILHARATKEYHPSEEFCALGSNTRSLAASHNKARFNTLALDRIALERHLGTRNSSAMNIGLDAASRWKQFTDVYCNRKDNNWLPWLSNEVDNGLTAACATDAELERDRSMTEASRNMRDLRYGIDYIDQDTCILGGDWAGNPDSPFLPLLERLNKLLLTGGDVEDVRTVLSQFLQLIANQSKNDKAIVEAAERIGRALPKDKAAIARELDNLKRVLESEDNEALGGAQLALCALTQIADAASLSEDSQDTRRGNRVNIDVDYARQVEEPRTIKADFTNELSTDQPEPTPEEEDILALSKNLYGHKDLYKPPHLDTATALKYLGLRSVAARRSVAQHSFSSIVGMKMSGSEKDPEATHKPTRETMAAVLRQLGMPEDEIEPFMGEHPSYYAQLEILAKKIYQGPGFYAGLYDKPVNVQRRKVAMRAIELLLDRAIYESRLRQEMLSAVLVAVHAEDETERIQSEINSMVGDE